MQPVEFASGLVEGVLSGLVVEASKTVTSWVTRSISASDRAKAATLDALVDPEFSPAFSLAEVLNWSDFRASAVEVADALRTSHTRSLFREVLSSVVLGEVDINRPRFEATLTAQLRARLRAEDERCLEELAHAALSEAINQFEIVTAGIRTRGDISAPLFASVVMLRAAVDANRLLLETAVANRDNPEFEASLDEWTSRYRRLCAAAHSSITPPDVATRSQVPIDELYVAPQVIAEYDDEFGDLDVMDLVGLLDRTVLLGDPGGGKSTATTVLAHTFASESRSKVPFVVVLREYGKVSGSTSVTKFIESQLDSYYHCAAPAGAVEAILTNGDAVVLFDGLDELLDTSERVKISERVEMFCLAFPHSAALVTSRKVGYSEARLNPTVFREYTIAGFDDDDVVDYANKWFRIQERESGEDSAEIAAHFIEESKSVPDLRRNPLLLALMCIIYRGQRYLPRNRTGVYEACSRLLFESWDRSRGIDAGLDFEMYLEAALKHLAFWMLTNESAEDGVVESALISEAGRFFADNAYDSVFEAQRAAKSFVDFCHGRAWVLSDAGTTRAGETKYKFTHRTFMEYFAASHLTRQFPEPENLASALEAKLARQEWDTVGQLAVHIVNGTATRGGERALRRLMDAATASPRDERENLLDFTARALENLAVPPVLIRDLVVQSFASYSDVLANLDLDEDTEPPSACLTLAQLDGVSFIPLRDQMKATILGAIQGEVDHDHVAALSVLAELPNFRGTRMTQPSRLAAWEEFVSDVYSENLDRVLALSRTDPYWVLLLVYRGSVEVVEYESVARETSDLPLDVFFRSPRSPVIRNHGLVSVANFVVTQAFRANIGEPRASAERRRATAAKMARRIDEIASVSTPPLVDSSEDFYLTGTPQRTNIYGPDDEWSESAILAAVLLVLAIGTEAARRGLAPPTMPRPSGLNALLSQVNADNQPVGQLAAVLARSESAVVQLLERWLAGDSHFIAD